MKAPQKKKRNLFSTLVFSLLPNFQLFSCITNFPRHFFYPAENDFVQTFRKHTHSSAPGHLSIDLTIHGLWRSPTNFEKKTKTTQMQDLTNPDAPRIINFRSSWNYATMDFSHGEHAPKSIIGCPSERPEGELSCPGSYARRVLFKKNMLPA